MKSLIVLLAIVFSEPAFSKAIESSHIERELKLSFWKSKETNTRKLAIDLYKVIGRNIPLIDQYSTLIGEELKTDQFITSMVFKDLYLDTDQTDLMSENKILRVRYRWNSSKIYKAHQLFSFMEMFYPHRAEIQLKKYDFAEYPMLLSEKTRSEFRLKRDQLYKQMNWDPKSLIKFANQKWKRDSALKLNTTLVLNRHRFHLRLPSIWGSGLNPDHVFIISLDEVECLNCTNKNRLVEVEVEIERNVAAKIDELLQTPREGFIAQEAKLFAQKTLNALKQDQMKIFELLTQELVNRSIALEKTQPKRFFFRDLNNREAQEL